MRGANPGSLQSKTSKVENGISSSLNPAHARFSRRTWTVSKLTRPPGHRLTPDRFHPLRKSSLCIANIFFGTSHFSNFLKLWKKVHLCPFRTSREYFDRNEAPRAPESASSRCARSFPSRFEPDLAENTKNGLGEMFLGLERSKPLGWTPKIQGDSVSNISIASTFVTGFQWLTTVTRVAHLGVSFF